MKRVILLITLLCVMLIGVEAQKKSLLQPVTVSDLSTGTKAFTDNMFMRFGVTLSANTIKLGYDENGEFTGFNSSYLSRVGFNVGYAHFIEKDGVAVNNYSVNGVIMTPTEGFSNLAVGATISAYNFALGVGYDFIKDVAFKQNVFLMFNAQLLF